MSSFPSTVSPRPTFIVDEADARVIEPITDRTYVGLGGTFGQFRMVTALPTNGDGPVMVSEPLVIGDLLSYLGDPTDGSFVGEHGPQYIHRMVAARWVENTRRLAG